METKPTIRIALRAEEAAKALGVSVSTLRGWKEVPYVLRGTMKLYPIRELIRFMGKNATVNNG